MASAAVLLRRILCQAPAPPVGWLDENTWWFSSKARQRWAERHDTPPEKPGSAPGSSATRCQCPRAGDVELSTLPAKSNITHRWMEGQEMPSRAFWRSTILRFQAPAPPPG